MPWNEPGSGNQDPWGNRRGNKSNSELDDIVNNLRKKFFGGGSKNTGRGIPIAIFLVIGLILYSLKAFYTVQEGYESVEFRFGKLHQTVGPGLRFIMWPIDSKVIVNSKNVRTLEVGFRKDTGRQQGSVPQEAQMLTTDENIADVSMAVQYNIRNVEDLLFHVGSVETPGVLDSVVRGATESALREVVGSTTLDNLLGKERLSVDTRTQDLLQKVLDRYQTGINIVGVEMQAALPPAEVREAFENVNKAGQLEQQLKKEAKAYEEKVVLRAEGSAKRILAEANAYKTVVIAKSSGESARFSKVLTEYRKAPEVTRKRLYIETMESVLSQTNKVVIDQKGGNNMMYLPLDQIIKKNQSGAVAPTASASQVPSSQINTSIERRQNRTQRGGR